MKNLKYFPYERNKYFYGKLLSVGDFQTEQKYMNDKRRLINRFLHGCGVVCGLRVVQVDDCSLSLETGMALDFAGREIVVDTPVVRNLSMIEGFDSYTEADEADSYLYLCIEYAQQEKEPVYNISGSDAKAEEYNKIAEGYRIYLTSQEPEAENFSSDSYCETSTVIYWGNGIRISQVLPKYVRAGETAEGKLIVENMGQKLPVSFSYKLSLDCFTWEEQNQIKISFHEEDFEKSRRYQIPFFLKAASVKDAKGKAQVMENSFQLTIGGKSMEAFEASGQNRILIVKEEIEDVIRSGYYRQAMEEIVKDTYHQSIYLAKINVIQAGNTFVIDEIHQMPFQQYVYNDVLAGVTDRIMGDRIKKLEQAVEHRKPFQEAEAGNRPDMMATLPQIATGRVSIDLGIGGTAGQKFFTEEITHGLGLGQVTVILGEACQPREDSPVVFGKGDIFEDGGQALSVETAAKADVTRGTFVIGLKLKETTTARRADICWTVIKDRKENAYEREERSMFIQPDMVSLKLRETYYFKPAWKGASNQEVNWKIKESEGGTIDRNGMYTAPNIPGVFEVVAESTAYPELRASAFVVVKE